MQFSSDEKGIIQERVQFLVKKILTENNIEEKDIISIFFSITKDLRSINPAAALRSGGDYASTPLFCAQEPDVDGALPRIIRTMVTTEIKEEKDKYIHVYLDGAEKLRPDLN